MRIVMSVFLTLAFCAGCSKATKAIDSTNEMNDKMSRMLESTNQMNEKTSKMLDNMTILNGTVEDQPILIPFESLLKQEYGKDLLPVPFDLMIFGQKYADNSKIGDLEKVFYLWMRKLNDVSLDKDAPTPDDVDAFNHEKLHVMMVLELVAGLMSDQKVQALIADQIYTDGRYRDTVFQMLMLRARFLRDVLLNADLLGQPMVSVGMLEESVKYADSLELLARLPFCRSLSVEISGFMPPQGEVSETFDPAMAKKMWEKIKRNAEGSLRLSEKDLSGSTDKDHQLFADQQRRYSEAMATVNQRISNWGQ